MRHSENKNKLNLGRWLSLAGPRFSPRPHETLMGSHLPSVKALTKFRKAVGKVRAQ